MELLGGPLFAVAGAGESHGPAIATLVFGCPAGLRLRRRDVQAFLDRRRPGSSRHGTTRREGDRVALLSGLYEEGEGLLGGPRVAVGDETVPSYEEGYTTGEPISALVLSASGRPESYAQLAGPTGAVRPGHADLVKHHKSGGFADPRGGGRSSYRSTISDVVGGSVARLYLGERFGVRILSSICQVGPLRATHTLAASLDALSLSAPARRLDDAALAELEARLDAPEMRTLDEAFAREAVALIQEARRDGDSLGAALEVVAVNVPPLLGEPLYESLKLRLMGSLGGLHAAQACEVGAGTDVAARRGSENNDPIRRDGYRANSHGGLAGGITTGSPLTCRVSFKPTSSILKPQASVRKDLEEIEFRLEKGRHDPCVGVRAGVTLESRMAIELLNAVLVHQARRVDPRAFRLF